VRGSHGTRSQKGLDFKGRHTSGKPGQAVDRKRKGPWRDRSNEEGKKAYLSSTETSGFIIRDDVEGTGFVVQFGRYRGEPVRDVVTSTSHGTFHSSARGACRRAALRDDGKLLLTHHLQERRRAQKRRERLQGTVSNLK